MNKKLFYIFVLFSFLISQLCYAQVGKREKDTLVNYIDINKKKQGKWTKNYDNGKIRYKGYFINDLPVGTFYYYHENGKIKSLLNYDDNHNSTCELFWDNGRIAARGAYNAQNQREGAWYLYFENEKLSSIINYKTGKADGNVKMYYPDTEKLVLDCNYKMGKLHGEYKKYFNNAKLQEEGSYDEGNRVGIWKYYSPDGSLEETGPMQQGKRHGKWISYKENKKGDTISYIYDFPSNYKEIMKEWDKKAEWAKKNQDKFKQPEDYLDNPMEFFKNNK